MGSEQFFNNFLLGVTASRIEVHNRTLNLAAVQRLCQSATYSLKIISRTLDPLIYENDTVVDAITQLACSGRLARIKILLFDAQALAQQGHRLLLLSQKVSSKVEIRVLSRDAQWHNESLVLADQHGYLFNPKSDRYEGEVDFCDPNRTAELDRTFSEYWDRSEQDAQLRRLSI